jgi:putative lipase involved disintegration of autophagic bodies
MYASRIGLLPELPVPGNSKPNYTDFLSSLEIYHFGNVDDPIYMGIFMKFYSRNMSWNFIFLLLV